MPVRRTFEMLCFGNVLSRVSPIRVFARLMAILALVLQLVAPSLASAADGEWIEICSEYGIVLQQIDLVEGDLPSDSGYPDCEDCTFCAFAAPLCPSSGVGFELSFASANQTSRSKAPEAAGAIRYQWPESRGPPTRHIDNNAERNSCVSQASTLIKGGALWT